MVSEPTESLGSAFVRELLTELPTIALPRVKAILRRYSGQVMHLPNDAEKADRITAARVLLDAGLKNHEVVDRISIQYQITRRHARNIVNNAKGMKP